MKTLKNTSSVKDKKAHKKKKINKKFQKAVNDKRIMLPILSFLGACVITVIVLMTLEAKGILFYPIDNSQSADGGSTEREYLDDIPLTSGNYQYKRLKDGTVELYFFTDGYATEVNVPAEIDGYKVSSIGAECFVWMPSITRVTIPEGITLIGANAFEGCGSLIAVNLPASLKTVEANAFKDCPSNMAVVYAGNVNNLSIAAGNTALTTALNK